MFGFSKKEMEKKLESLIQVAMLDVYGVCKTKSFKVKGELLSDSDNDFFAGAVTNYLFAMEHSSQHLERFESVEIESVGLQLVKNNDSLKELIVQSQRAYYIVNYGYKVVDAYAFPTMTEILSKYGEEFPKIPNPASYELLIHTWKH
jgi:hypothetical protein